MFSLAGKQQRLSQWLAFLEVSYPSGYTRPALPLPTGLTPPAAFGSSHGSFQRFLPGLGLMKLQLAEV